MTELKRALQLLTTTGWVGPEHEPWCLDSQGRHCLHNDEGLAKYSVTGALQACGVRNLGLVILHQIVSPRLGELEAFIAAYVPTDEPDYDEELERWVDTEAEARFEKLERAATGEYLDVVHWLQQGERTQADVLGLLRTAVLREKRK